MDTYVDPSRVMARYKQASFEKEANLLNIVKSIFYDVPKSSFKGVSSEILLLSARLFKLHKGAIVKGCGATFESHVLSMLPLNIRITQNPLSRYQGLTIPKLVKFNPLDPMASSIQYGDFYTTDLYGMVDLSSEFMDTFFGDDMKEKVVWAKVTANFYRAWANKYLAVLLKAQGKEATVKSFGIELDMNYKSLIGQMATLPAYIFAHLFRILYYLPANIRELIKETLYLLLVAFIVVLKAPVDLGKAIIKLFNSKIKPLAVQGQS